MPIAYPLELESLLPITVYGSSVSYFTGKLENYFRLKGIPYKLEPMRFPADEKRVKELTGVMQMPAVELGDGRWMTDTTAIIAWFDTLLPQPPIVPEDPVQAFVCHLLEDYADEWLWRPAMHYRWHYTAGAELLSRHLADEVLSSLPAPGFYKRWLLRRRQREGYTTGDGITPDNVGGVESIFLDNAQALQHIFEQRPFLFGDQPSLADIGFSGPFFRHFALDPIPQEILRSRAPAVYEWVARLWNTGPVSLQPNWISGVPKDIDPLLDCVGRQYLPYLCANAEAVAQGHTRFSPEVDGVRYHQARHSRYRVWCLDQLRQRFRALPPAAEAEVEALLEKHGCWEPLWRIAELPLAPEQEQGLPFRGSTKMVGANE